MRRHEWPPQAPGAEWGEFSKAPFDLLLTRQPRHSMIQRCGHGVSWGRTNFWRNPAYLFLKPVAHGLGAFASCPAPDPRIRKDEVL